jgi:hypothetical protein
MLIATPKCISICRHGNGVNQSLNRRTRGITTDRRQKLLPRCRDVIIQQMIYIGYIYL